MVQVKTLPVDHPRQDPRLGLTSRFFRVLGDPTRLRILELLLDGEKTVTEIVEAIGYPQGRISSHLTCLRWCGFIGTRRNGRYIHYYLSDHRVSDLLAVAQSMMADNAEAILTCTRIDGRC